MEKVDVSELNETKIKRARHAFRVVSRGKEIAVVFPGSTVDLDTLEIMLSPELVRQLRTPDTHPRTTLKQLLEKERLVRTRTRKRR